MKFAKINNTILCNATKNGEENAPRRSFLELPSAVRAVHSKARTKISCTKNFAAGQIRRPTAFGSKN